MNKELIRVKNIKINTTIGKKYQIRLKNISGKNRHHLKYKPFEGILIQDTDNCLIFKGEYYCEAFLKIDFAIKDYEIRESTDNHTKWTKPLQVKY